MTARRQTITSVTLAAMILAAWATLHVGGIFFYPLPGNVALVVAAVLAQTWLSAGLFIVMHDCIHGSFAPGRPRLNAAVGMVCAALYACFGYRGLAANHHLHHRFPGTADDPDFDARDPRAFVRWYVHFFSGYYTHGQLLRITVAAVAYLLLGASLLNIVVFWAVPALLSSVQLFLFGTWLPHRHDDRAFADHHNARSNGFGWGGSLVTCFHFGGFHHEHHLHPALPWWALPQARKRAL
ncbi:fatty acid desaturase [Sphingoaurantiacus capsulatus]|uniref:Fatty acid desaturase n=1 Tax=Sphingoaurantiacus capsulatus TaxID=1771310 RepID=A0ABV7XCY6_9SPHN